jgi:hypothetical protein
MSSLKEEFLRKLQKPSSQPRQDPLTKDTNVAGKVFVPGVNKMVSIPVIQLFMK